MAAKKKAKKAIGKKDMKKTKGGLNFATPDIGSIKMGGNVLKIDGTLNPDAFGRFK